MWADRLAEADSLGAELLRRIEANEPLSVIAPAARRFFVLIDDRPLAAWMRLEADGLEIDQRTAEERSKDERDGALLFSALRRAAQLADIDLDQVLESASRPASTEFVKRGVVMYQSLADLESKTPPEELDAASRQSRIMREAWAALRLQFDEARRILNLERQTLHRLVLERHELLRSERAVNDLFGEDASMVLKVGGRALEELRAAAVGVRAGHSASSLGQQARTVVMALGRDLYAGSGGTHVSPIDGKSHEVRQEMNKLHAVLDGLWEQTPNRRKMIEDAQRSADVAYELGSKAKNPLAITRDEAVEALREAYRVAHAICFAGGFPTRDQTADGTSSSAPTS